MTLFLSTRWRLFMFAFTCFLVGKNLETLLTKLFEGDHKLILLNVVAVLGPALAAYLFRPRYVGELLKVERVPEEEQESWEEES